jgi:hypothetical protein
MYKRIVILCLLVLFGVFFIFLCEGTADFESYNPSKGYCGPGKWVIPKFLSLFNEACYGHDKCYNQCKNTKNTKAFCDDEFYTAMKIKCDDAQSKHYDDCMKLSTTAAKNACKLANVALHKECIAAAKAHYEAVKNGADKFHAYNCTADDLKPYQPTVDLKVNNSDGPITIPLNSSATLSWSAIYVAYCTASGDWSGSKNAGTGSQSTGPLTTSKTYKYTLTCKNSSGASATKTVQVNVVPPLPTVNIKATDKNGTSSDGPVQIYINTASTLSWTSTNATSCTASGDWSGSKPTSGSGSTGNLTLSKTYTLTCNGPGGSASDRVTVNVASTGGVGGGGGGGGGTIRPK